MARWRTTVSIDAKAARGIAAHVATLQTDRGPAGAHAACALVKLAYASPHHRAKIVQAGALKPLVELLRDGAEAQGGPGFSAVKAACQVVGVGAVVSALCVMFGCCLPTGGSQVQQILPCAVVGDTRSALRSFFSTLAFSRRRTKPMTCDPRLCKS